MQASGVHVYMYVCIIIIGNQFSHLVQLADSVLVCLFEEHFSETKYTYFSSACGRELSIVLLFTMPLPNNGRYLSFTLCLDSE